MTPVRASLVRKLVLAYLVPTLALLIFTPLLGYAVARRALEAEVGQRLVGSAGAAASSLRGELLVALQPGDESSRTYRNSLSRLDSLRAAAKVERLYSFDRKRQLLVGTGQVPPIGSPLPELERDRAEVERALAGEATASAVTFKGLDGRTYKSGYAPVLDADGKVVAVVGADASAEFFDALRELGTSMVVLALFFGGLGLALFWAVGSRWLVRPLRELLGSVERIGRGDLASTVPAVGKDELGALAAGMEQMRGKLLDRERELQMMLAGIAHEVRNPLGGIELFAGLLAEDLAGDAEKLGHVRKVQRELGHLKRVVEDFLGYAREQKLEKEPVQSRALLAELAELAQADAEARSVKLEVLGEDFSFQADVGSLRRALLNLVRNAIQASPQGGNVRLEARRQGERVVLRVADEGPGIKPEERARLFTPFHTTKEKGLGLGLALVRRIAEAHGGVARLAESERGATFEIELPAG